MTVAISFAEFFAFFASSAVWRFRVGRSGSSVEGVLAVVEPVSAGVLPVGVVDAGVVVVSLPEGALSGVRRFMVGRSGSSAGVEVLLGFEPVAVPVPGSAVVLDAVSEPRRFMVGRSGSSLVDGLVVLDAVVVSGLFVVWLGAGLLGSLPVAGVVSVPGFEPKWGRFGSLEVVRTGSVFEGFKAVVVFLGADRGLTLP